MSDPTPRPGMASEIGAAMRANFKPGLVIWAIALAVVLLYYQVPATRTAFETVRGWREAGGYFYAAISTMIFGGIIPVLLLRSLGRVPPDRFRLELGFACAFWLWKGAEVALLYKIQVRLFGSASQISVVAPKVAFDQFVYNPLWAVPTSVLCYAWKEAGLRPAAIRGLFNRDAFLRTCPVVLVSTWLVWVPAVAIVYCMPESLQLPVFNLVLCFWVLLLAFLTGRR